MSIFLSIHINIEIIIAKEKKLFSFFRLYYKPGTWLDGYPTLINGDGDGTVNRRSLEACVQWTKMQKQKVFYKPLPKVNHMDILRNELVLSYIQSVIKTKIYKERSLMKLFD